MPETVWFSQSDSSPGGDLRVLVIGATGMLGRPVLRRLVRDGFTVRAVVRDEMKARKLLPREIDLIAGDLRDADSIRRAIHDIDAIHINLSQPMVGTPPEFDPDLDGTRAVVRIARESGLPHITRISALGVEDAADEWWAARHKLEADQAVIDSGLPFTIFRPTWLMESLALFLTGPCVMVLRLPGSSVRWIAGDDYARQVAWALRQENARNRILHPQGPELVAVSEAIHRFRRALGTTRVPIPLPRAMIQSMRFISGKNHYFAKLIDMTVDHFAPLDREVIDPDLPAPTMRIEEYARYIEETGDVPRK